MEGRKFALSSATHCAAAAMSVPGIPKRESYLPLCLYRISHRERDSPLCKYRISHRAAAMSVPGIA
eukprot:2275687-Rhodomonas_salina.1